MLLNDLLERAEKSEATVRAAALLRVARVETATDAVAARSTFERGLDAIRRLPSLDAEFLLEQAALIAAAVAPDLLDGPPGLSPPPMFEHTVLQVMLDHGHLEDAVSRLLHHENSAEFPFGMVHVIIRRVADTGVKVALVRRAIEAWRDAPPYDELKPPDNDFVRLFQSEWNQLPRAESLVVVREIVRLTAEQPEQPMTASYANGAVEITSWRAHVFFEMLHILRHLDPELAELLIAGHPQLAEAARRFPKGRESIEAEEAFPRKESPHRSSRDGDFEPQFDHALEKYRRDSNPESPNLAPRELWPSTCAYRNILYQAGKRLGADAPVYLERVPDDDLRLFAHIEFAAALAGLPQFREIQREFRRSAANTQSPTTA